MRRVVKLLTRRQGWYIPEWVGRIDTSYKNANWQSVPMSTRLVRIKDDLIQRASWILAMVRLTFAVILYVVASERSQAHSLKYPVKRDALNWMNSRNTASSHVAVLIMIDVYQYCTRSHTAGRKLTFNLRFQYVFK